MTNPGPRDELIKVYEEALEFYDCYCRDDLHCRIVANEPTDKVAREALAQGAEIKKRMEEG